ncbi:MAG: DNA repair protein RecO [Erysipelotrichaceae bacterium]|nr:DNA repair protein RecO [Erysipelotrichaceae bacterium]
MLLKIKGIVIKEIGYKTSDKIVSILTMESEIVSFKAKGAKKLTSPFAKITMIGTICEFELESKVDNGKYELVEAKQLLYPKKISKSIESLAVLSFIIESLNYIKDVPDLYDEITYLVTLLENNINPLFVVTYYVMKMISWEGITLELDKCVKCGSSKSIVDLDYKLGGYVCYKCTFSTKDNTYLKLVRLFQKIEKENLSNLILDYDLTYTILLNLWDYFLDFGSYRLRSFEFLKQSLL